MPRPPAPCGTYPAYRRHLRRGERVDAKCRAAQKAHDGGRSTSAPARAQRAKPNAKAVEPAAPVVPTPLTDEGHISRLEVLKELLELQRALLPELRKSDPRSAYLLMREQRDTLREISELQGNGQVKGVTLADQLADARARRRAGTAAS